MRGDANFPKGWHLSSCRKFLEEAGFFDHLRLRIRFAGSQLKSARSRLHSRPTLADAQPQAYPDPISNQRICEHE